MFILRDLLTPLQEEFSNTKQGQKRKVWFAYTLLAVVLPFTSSITSNLLRALHTLFGLEIKSQRFYTFMGSTTLPWKGLWRRMWGQIPQEWQFGHGDVALFSQDGRWPGEEMLFVLYPSIFFLPV